MMKIFKTLTTLTIAIACVFSVAAKTLNEQVVEMNSKCPVYFQDGWNVQSFVLTDTLFINISVEGDMAQYFPMMRENAELMTNMIKKLPGYGKAWNELIELSVQDGKPVNVNLSAEGHAAIVFSFTPNDFKTTPILTEKQEGFLVLNSETKEPIPFASVGIIEKTFGTVTDSNGRFKLNIPEGLIEDTLRVSSIGYATFELSVSELSEHSDTIYLKAKPTQLREVVVKPTKLKHKRIGRLSNGGMFAISADGHNGAGKGFAVPISVKKRAWIEDVSFAIMETPKMLSKMKFRINFYIKGGKDKYTLTDISSVYFDYSKEQIKDDRFTFTFMESVCLDKGNYYIELEFLEDFPDEEFIMKSNIASGQTRFRYASQTAWKKIPVGNTLSFSVTEVK